VSLTLFEISSKPSTVIFSFFFLVGFFIFFTKDFAEDYKGYYDAAGDCSPRTCYQLEGISKWILASNQCD